jgi:hypothetical protein
VPGLILNGSKTIHRCVQKHTVQEESKEAFWPTLTGCSQTIEFTTLQQEAGGCPDRGENRRESNWADLIAPSLLFSKKGLD